MTSNPSESCNMSKPSQQIVIKSRTGVTYYTSKYLLNIYFKQQCLKKNLTPNYAKIKIPYSSPTTKFTQQRIEKLHVSDKTKFLYLKKENLICGLYLAHLSSTQEWSKTQYVIENYVNKAVNEELRKKIQDNG